MKLEGKVLEQVLLCAEDFYIIDDTTHELLYVSNSVGTRNTNAIIGRKCYEALHGLVARCAQCPSTDLCKESQQAGALCYRWERFDAERNIWYQVRHRVVVLDGRFCRIAYCNVVEGMMQLGSEAIKEIGSLMNLLEENSKIKRQLEYDNTHDMMTGLYNRNRYTHDLELFADIRSMGVVYVDINNLKETNDQFGHAKGDELICAVGRCMHLAAPTDARCYRIGGDEFVVLLPNGTAVDTERCRGTFFSTLTAENNRLAHPCSVACGVAHGNSPYVLSALIASAESKMYVDKCGHNKQKVVPNE